MIVSNINCALNATGYIANTKLIDVKNIAMVEYIIAVII